MKKTYLLWFAILAFLVVGCRNDNFNPNDSQNNQQALKFRIVSRSEIPQLSAPYNQKQAISEYLSGIIPRH